MRWAILGAVRTPFCRAGGQFAEVSVHELARAAMTEALARAEVPVGAIDEVIVGCAGQPHDAQNVGRVAALRAGIPEATPAFTVHRNCASGCEALMEGALRIAAGRGEVFLIAGVEGMSRAPLLFPDAMGKWLSGLMKARSGLARMRQFARFRPSLLRPRISLLEGLTDPVSGLLMGETAEVLAREFGISRAEQDEYALRSHQLAAAAAEGGRLQEEVAPAMVDPVRTFTPADDGIRADQSLEKLGKLKPYFDRRYGSVTAGNACQVTDGAAALVLTSEARAHEFGSEPLGYLTDYANAGLDPRRMGLGPVYATAKLLERVGRQLDDYPLIELNEAFAVQVLACQRAFQSDEFAREYLGLERALGELKTDRLNVNGGAIALGHPVGATGLRIAMSLLFEMRRRGVERGLATLCVGGGQGAALELEAA